MLYSLCIPFHGYKTLCCLPMQTHTLLWLPLKLCCGFPLLVRQPHCSRRSTEQQNALSFIILISTSSSFFSSAAQENIQSRSELLSLHVSESLKLTVHLTFFFFFFFYISLLLFHFLAVRCLYCSCQEMTDMQWPVR